MSGTPVQTARSTTRSPTSDSKIDRSLRNVWFFNPKSDDWELGEWIKKDISTKILTFQIGNERLEVNTQDTCELDLTHLQDLDDICNMNNLHEAPLLDMLR